MLPDLCERGRFILATPFAASRHYLTLPVRARSGTGISLSLNHDLCFRWPILGRMRGIYMFILGDESQHHGKFPWVTCGLIVVNVLCFCLQQFIGERFTNGFSLVPL